AVSVIWPPTATPEDAWVVSVGVARVAGVVHRRPPIEPGPGAASSLTSGAEAPLGWRPAEGGGGGAGGSGSSPVLAVVRGGVGACSSGRGARTARPWWFGSGWFRRTRWRCR